MDQRVVLGAAAGAAALACCAACNLRQRDALMELAAGINSEAPKELKQQIKVKHELEADKPIPKTQEELLAELDTSPSPRYSLDDPAWLEHLEREGYVVLAGVVEHHEVRQAEGLLWDFICENSPTLKRDDHSTWTDAATAKVCNLQNGLMNAHGMGQSDFLWYLRTLPSVRRVFETIWNESSLLVSFDGAGAFRPWNHGFGKTLGGWWHVDQGRKKQGRHAVQGLVSLYDADASTGGLTVVPGSHHRFGETVATMAHPNTDYYMVQRSHPVMQELPKRLVCCRAGDLILWDSRTIHANAPATVMPTCPPNRLLRAVAYICMVPARFAPEQVRRQRRDAYQLWVSTSHWPQKFDMGSMAEDKAQRRLEDAPEAVKALVG